MLLNILMLGFAFGVVITELFHRLPGGLNDLIKTQQPKLRIVYIVL